LNAAAGVDPDAKDGSMKWTVFGLAKAQSKIGADSISQVGEFQQKGVKGQMN